MNKTKMGNFPSKYFEKVFFLFIDASFLGLPVFSISGEIRLAPWVFYPPSAFSDSSARERKRERGILSFALTRQTRELEDFHGQLPEQTIEFPFC